jgi:LEA14-like dessication related protein
MLPRSLRLPAALAITGAIVAGCGGGGGGNVEPENILIPHVEVGQVAVKSLGLQGGHLAATLVVVNPNEFSLPGTGIGGTLYLGGVQFGALDLNEGYVLHQEDTTRVTVPVTFQWTSVGYAARGILGYGSVDYTARGTLYVLSPKGRHFSLPFSASGSVPIVQALSGASH